MAELGKLVPILPVVMKADTMTINEAQRFRQEVSSRLQVGGEGGGASGWCSSPHLLCAP
jgi:hypothetical protein